MLRNNNEINDDLISHGAADAVSTHNDVLDVIDFIEIDPVEGINDLTNNEELSDVYEVNDGASSDLPQPYTVAAFPSQPEPPSISPENPFRQYYNIVDINDAPFIFAEDPSNWDAYKFKSFIEQSHEAMSKFSVNIKVLQILSRGEFKVITEHIIGFLDWTTKIDSYLFKFSHRSRTNNEQLQKLQNIRNMEDEEKRKEAERRIKTFDESVVSFLDILAFLRNIMAHYSQQTELGKLRKALGGNTYPDNVVQFCQRKFPGFVTHLLVVLKVAYPSEKSLCDVLQF